MRWNRDPVLREHLGPDKDQHCPEPHIQISLPRLRRRISGKWASALVEITYRPRNPFHPSPVLIPVGIFVAVVGKRMLERSGEAISDFVTQWLKDLEHQNPKQKGRRAKRGKRRKRRGVMEAGKAKRTAY